MPTYHVNTSYDTSILALVIALTNSAVYGNVMTGRSVGLLRFGIVVLAVSIYSTGPGSRCWQCIPYSTYAEEKRHIVLTELEKNALREEAGGENLETICRGL